MEMEQLVSKITAEILRTMQNQGSVNTPSVNTGNVAGMIDHTLLKQNASEEQIVKLCQEAKEYHFCSVCVNPCYVPLCYEELRGSGVKVCTVIGFPLGATTTKSKIFEANEAIENGANEVDMVVNVGKIKSGNWQFVKKDIADLVTAVHGRAIVKVIIETCLLTDEEKVKVCQIAKEAGADFVKTSTGFSTGGATVADVALMRKTVGPDMGVKASGGVRVIFVLRNVNNSVNIDNQNCIHPFYMVYIGREGDVICDYLNPKQLLDDVRLLCRGKSEPIKEVYAKLNEETDDGRNMAEMSELLSMAIDSIINTKEESDIDSLFSAVGTSALMSDISGLSDFELICFLVVK